MTNIMKKLIGSNSRLLTGMFSLLIIFSISTGCKKIATDMYGSTGTTGTKGSGGPGTNEVWIQGMTFSPASITVAAGTTILWTNKDAVAHTVTSNTGAFDSGNISTNGTFSFTFSSAGTFDYHCSVHPSMTAKVIVN